MSAWATAKTKGSTGLAVLALAARSGAYYVETVVAPALASEAPALFEGFPTDAPWSTFRVVSGGSFMMVSVGLVVLCVGVLRAGMAPRWANVVVALAALLAAGLAPAGPQAVAPLVTAALSVGLIGWAAWLWTNAVEHHTTGDLTA